MERLTEKTELGSLVQKSSVSTRDVIDKLGRYEDAEEHGLIPKFFLGEEFWTTWCRKVVKAKVVMLQQKKDGSWKYRLSCEITGSSHSTCDFKESDFGKYFFINKVDAEKKVKEDQREWEEQRRKLMEANK